MGVITTPRRINAGEELFLSYGNNYNWDSYKQNLLQHLIETLFFVIQKQARRAYSFSPAYFDSL